MEGAETEAENIQGTLRTSRGPPCAPSRLCPRAHLTHPHLSSALGQSHEGAAGAILNEELREMGDAAWWPEWEAGGQVPTRDSESSSVFLVFPKLMSVFPSCSLQGCLASIPPSQASKAGQSNFNVLSP